MLRKGPVRPHITLCTLLFAYLCGLQFAYCYLHVLLFVRILLLARCYLHILLLFVRIFGAVRTSVFARCNLHTAIPTHVSYYLLLLLTNTSQYKMSTVTSPSTDGDAGASQGSQCALRCYRSQCYLFQGH